MTNHSIKNVAASVKARLLNLARSRERPYQELLQYYAMERLLYRLSISEYGKKFVLKGALLFAVWQVDAFRATLDIDMLAHTSNALGNLVSIFTEVCSIMPDVDDGIFFDASSMKKQVMQTDARYPGVRVRFWGCLESTRIPLQIDVGFGDIVTPKARSLKYPTLLDFPEPILETYPAETVVAEKLQTMIKRGMANTRIKDFYDVWHLIQQHSLKHDDLRRAIENTFRERNTPLRKSEISQLLQA